MNPIAKRSSRRRTMVASGFVLLVLGGFVLRLVDIQVVHAAEHVEDAGSKMTTAETLWGNRGSIVDEHGVVLASSTMTYDVNIDPTLAKDLKITDADGTKHVRTWDEQASAIAEVLGMTPDSIKKIVADKQATEPESQWAQLTRGVTTAQYQALRNLEIPALDYDAVPARAYPNGAVAGNLIGFESSDGEALAGIERWQNDCLESKNGSVKYQFGADSGVRIPGSEKLTPAQDGGKVQLTIDSDLQWYMEQMIAEETQNQKAVTGTVTVVDVKTGAIRAAAQYPAMDPNDVLATDPAHRGSAVFGTTFEPGSTFKAITAASLLEEGVANPMTTVTAGDFERFANGAALGDSHSHPVQTYTLAGALIDSSNVALSHLGELLPDVKRWEWLKKFGITGGPVVGFPGEENGFMRPPSEWDPQTHYTTTFGQGFTATVPQVVSAYQTIANDGVRVPLSLVESCTAPDGTVTTPEKRDSERVISEKTAADMQLMLENVAFQSSVADQIRVPGYSIAAKTGTAQKTDSNGGYKAGVYFTSIVGFAPAEDPQYVVMITLDEPKRVTSSAATAPALQKAMTHVLQSYRIVPGRSEPETVLPMLK
ncbi:peptidoglycan D,D-transpeptidase FtsI family protein [Microbacterium phosphatis]|uniref:peptidoglycan D,D-transpeptidase FtsI family protein n=1 Tax=Microbacterium phosphatis TaxID=3140248 RepID=UPI0031409A3E